jgi:hypothetical protein
LYALSTAGVTHAPRIEETYLLKQIAVDINQASWKGTYPFPPELQAAKKTPTATINFASALLLMGLTALVKAVPRWQSAIRWAQVKYAYSVDHAADLRLHRSMAGLEKHQKSVLSEEWSTGIALEWLTDIFDYTAFAHADLVVRRLASLGMLVGSPSHKKSGPTKCPDFIAVDSNRQLHIIECKGTVSGDGSIRQSFQQGRLQKGTIDFGQNDSTFVAQRLCVGVSIATGGDGGKTTLFVEDPPKASDGTSHVCTVKGDVTMAQIEQAILTSAVLEQAALAGAYDVLRAAETGFSGLDDHFFGAQDLRGDLIKFEMNGKSWIGQRFTTTAPISVLPGHNGSTIQMTCGMSVKLRRALLDAEIWLYPLILGKFISFNLSPKKKTRDSEGILQCSIMFGSEFIWRLDITSSTAL